ncbi:MAG: hypothetical protein Q4C95_10145, partial [Planctomycetia bacterium]|nr:hypothetical protein [Planctomycetia bacterium]
KIVGIIESAKLILESKSIYIPAEISFELTNVKTLDEANRILQIALRCQTLEDFIKQFAH